MRSRLLSLSVLAAVAVVVPSTTALGQGPAGARALPPHSQRPVCGPPAAGSARCHSQVVTTLDGVKPLATAVYTNGYAPASLQAAYAVPAAAGSGPTVAIVDAYDNPNVESDLATYRAQFGLPSCTSATGCFRKVNQSGGSSMPRGDTGWGQEIALDVEMVSAVCPGCKILLVEASSSSLANLLTAENLAASRAQYVSNSWGTNEFSLESLYDSYFNHAGVAITVSSGDSGYGVQWPAASPTVTAVGGTRLSQAAGTTRGFSETAWSGAGSGCSAYEPKPSWQTDRGCARRTVADVSAVADPSTGVAVYDSYGSSGGANWYVFGGTSVAAPIVASVYALGGAGGTAAIESLPYSHTGALYDVTSGSNGSCGGSYLCTATTGYDGPTGLGTPNGTGAFGGTGSGGGGTNTPPTAAFSDTCASLTCSFTDTSTDPDGTIASWSWSFGDGATSTEQNPSHTYGTTGQYTVTLQVTDNGGATATTQQPVTVSSTTSYSLTATTSKASKNRTAVQLTWTPADTVTVYRNGGQIATGTNGSYTDTVRSGRSYTYQVCNSANVCSNNLTVQT